MANFESIAMVDFNVLILLHVSRACGDLDEFQAIGDHPRTVRFFHEAGIDEGQRQLLQ
jgi:hypothetical protein